MRVFRISEIIRNSKQPIEIKMVMKICSYIFYLALYIHWLACIFNYLVLFNEPLAFIIQRDGTYMDVNSMRLHDQNGSLYYFDGRDIIFTLTQTFALQDWLRLTENDGVLGWKNYNQRWDARSS